MHFLVEEVHVCAELIVPALLGLEGDGLAYVVVVLLRVRYLHVSSGRLGGTFQFGLQDVAEHLYVISSRAVSFRHQGVDVAAVVAYSVGQSHLGQQLVEAGLLLVLQQRPDAGLHVGAHDALVEGHCSQRAVVYLHLREVVAQSQCCREARGDVDVRLVEQGVVVGRCAEQSRHRLHVHAYVASSGPLYHGGGGLHAHALGHGVEHTVVGIVLDGLREVVVHGGVEVNGRVGLQRLIGEEGSRRGVPRPAARGLQRQLLRDGVLQLCLRDVHVVQGPVVNVHEHVVLQVLPRGAVS